MVKNEEVRTRIENNYLSITSLQNIMDLIPNYADRLELVSVCGLLYSEFVTGLYSNSELEQEIANIGKTIPFEQTECPKDDEYLIVMTKAGNIGGHSVIANNWITWDKNIKYSIVFTDFSLEYVPEFLKKSVNRSGGNIFFLNGGYLEKAKQLLGISQQFSKIILLQHMYDLIPDLAYSNPNWKIPIFLYNHANFKFSFGYEISDCVLNLLNYDRKKTILYRGVREKNTCVLQFPNAGNLVGLDENSLPKKNEIFNKFDLDIDKKLVVSMGDGFKFKNIVGCSFVSFAKNLVLTRNDVQYVIIGPNPNDSVWMQLEQTTKGLAKAVGYLRREEANSIISYADLYVASFPMTSSGSNIAEAYGVPYLLMELTGRGRENYSTNLVSSVTELMNKANEILDGNKDGYLGTYYKKIIDQEKWCKIWHEIADSVKTHKGQVITPKRRVETEEIINCQLMQERADQTVKVILQNHRLTPRIANKLFEICSKYDLHFMPDYFSVTEWNIQKKNETLASYTNKWLQLKLKEISIAGYLKELGIHEVAIYGMGQMGLNLYAELKNTDISIECFIDRNANRLNSPISIIGIEEIPKQSHCIINTVFLSTEQLRDSYACLPENYRIVSLFDILDTLYGRPE